MSTKPLPRLLANHILHIWMKKMCSIFETTIYVRFREFSSYIYVFVSVSFLHIFMCWFPWLFFMFLCVRTREFSSYFYPMVPMSFLHIFIPWFPWVFFIFLSPSSHEFSSYFYPLVPMSFLHIFIPWLPWVFFIFLSLGSYFYALFPMSFLHIFMTWFSLLVSSTLLLLLTLSTLLLFNSIQYDTSVFQQNNNIMPVYYYRYLMKQFIKYLWYHVHNKTSKILVSQCIQVMSSWARLCRMFGQTSHCWLNAQNTHFWTM